MRTRTASDRAVGAFAFAVVAGRWLIPVAWVAAAVLAWLALPPLSGSGQSPLSDIVPPDSRALAAQQRALERFGTSMSTDTVVVQRNPRGLTQEEVEATARGALDVREGRLPTELGGIRAAVPVVNRPVGGVEFRERDTTALTYLFMSAELNLLERDATVEAYSERYLRESPETEVGATGAAPARLAQFEVIDSRLPWIEAATVAVIVLIVSLYFRSIGAPLVTLFTAALAYVLAIRVLSWTGEAAGVSVPSEIEPVLVVLLLGLVTDYTIFFLSEARRRLSRGEPRVRAARGATSRIAPVVLAAGILVAAGAAALLAGGLEFFRVFGPGMAVAALVVTIVCATLVPALIALWGPWLFGRAVREAERAGASAAASHPGAPAAGPRRAVPAAPSDRRPRRPPRFAAARGILRASRRHAREEGRPLLGFLGARILASWPVSLVLAVVCVGVLAVAASGARSSELGISFIASLPAESETRRAADAAARGFLPGVLAPAEVVLEQPGIAARRAELVRLQGLVEDQPGVAAVLGPREQVADPLPDFALSPDGGAARFGVIFERDPTGPDAIDALEALQERLPGLARQAGVPAQLSVSYGGETALAAETVDAVLRDLVRIAVAAAVVMFLLLALFLRALLAPALLLAASVLAFAGSYGLVALLLAEVFDNPGFIYYVPLVGAVLLVALGSDYNVFIAARIREEVQRRRLRDAIAVAAPAASRAITVAGVTLASTFALLALVPLRPFRELALLMSAGVLVDALLVRPLLIPALISLAGSRAWWPGRTARPVRTRAFVRRVAEHIGRPAVDAARIADATLRTLGERIPEAHARELGRHLSARLAAPLLSGGAASDSAFGSEEFLHRVAQRASVSEAMARDDVRGVFATIHEALPDTEIEHLQAALSQDYAALLDPQPPRAGPEPAVAR